MRAPDTSRKARVRRWARGFRDRDTWAAYAFLSPWLLGFVVFLGGPMIISLVLSFTDYDGLRETGNVGFANYEKLLSDPKVRTSLTNTIIYAIMVVPGTMIVALGLAMMLSRVGRRSAGVFRTLFYLPEVTPKVAVGVLFLMLFNGQVGLVNGALGLVGIDGPDWSTDPAWVKPGLALMKRRHWTVSRRGSGSGTSPCR
jgi:multiple sugar transport system permease protein